MLRKSLDKLHPLFTNGGKLEKLYPVYEAIDTFLYSPGDVARGGTHVRDALDLKRMMIMVVVALVPCIYMALWNTGYQAHLAMDANGDVLAADGWRGMVFDSLGLAHDPNSWIANIVYGSLFFFPVYIVTLAAGGTCEAIFSIIRKHEINEGFLVTSMLYALILPPTLPLWMAALGIIFGVVIGKEVFGGTGKNFLNPALTSRVFVYFAYPAEMTGDTIWTAVRGVSNGENIDAYTNATSLGAVALPGGMDNVTAEAAGQMAGVTWMDAFLGTIQGSMGETSALACLLGAIILVLTGVGNWRIIVSVLLGAFGFSALLHYGFPGAASNNPAFSMPPYWHMVVGSIAFGAVFMATDPVSSSMTRTGMWVYGALIGIVTIIVRVVNPAFPEGVNLAILFGNVFAPLIDYAVVQANIKRRIARTAMTA